METTFSVDTKMDTSRLDTKFYIALAQVDIAAHPMLAVSWRIFHNAEM